jgi:phosphoglycolate phosphatase-like HAD superfamily hydrolase
MQINHLIFDADGVLVDSKKIAWQNAYKIISLFYSVEPFKNYSEFKKHFGREAQIKLVGKDESEILRAMHRLLMRHNSSDIRCFDSVLDIISQIHIKKSLVTSAISSGIKNILGENQYLFNQIIGRDHNSKINALKDLYSSKAMYVTDSCRDINVCHEIGLVVTGVGWGYDEIIDIDNCKPDYFTETPKDLLKLFKNLKLV